MSIKLHPRKADRQEGRGIARGWIVHPQLPSNFVNAKVVLCDLALLFEGQQFETNISEMVRARSKIHGTTFVDFDAC